MIVLRTGLPGASKTLNTLREITSDKNLNGRVIYYNNINILLLDIDVCTSFHGYFYGYFLPQLDEKTKAKYQKQVIKIHQNNDKASLEYFPHLKGSYREYLETNAHADLFLYWVKRVYSDDRLKPLNDYLDINPTPSLDDLKTFNLDWRHFDDPKSWFELPRGSIIVIDECQQWFPPRQVGAKVPQHCSEFETHRHKGWDIHLITQDAKLLDTHVRRLTNTHVNYFNPFKSNRVTRLEADKVFNPQDYHERKNTRSSNIKRDSKYYGVYYSADVHTAKLIIPWKAVAIIPAILLIIFLVWFVVSGSFLGDSAAAGNKNKSDSKVPNQIVNTNVSGDKKTKQLIKPVYFPELSFTKAQTPLQNMCDSFEYSARFVTLTRGRVQYDYFFNCNVLQTSNKEDDSEQVITQTYDDDYLRQIGFKITELSNHSLLLEYQNTRIVFRNPF